VAARFLEQLAPVMGEERLVGGDHVLARRERLEDERARRLEAPDQLDDDLDLRVVEGLVGVGHQGELRQVEPLARPLHVGLGDAVKHEPAARPLLHLGAMGLQHFDHAAAHRAESEKGDLDVGHVRPGGRRRPAPGLMTRRMSEKSQLERWALIIASPAIATRGS
jgi:hypothetical protein